MEFQVECGSQLFQLILVHTEGRIQQPCHILFPSYLPANIYSDRINIKIIYIQI